MNFKNVKVKDLEGRAISIDVSKNFANFIYQTTGDLGMLEVAQEIYKIGEAELTADQKTEIKQILEHPQCPFVAIVKRELLNLLK